MGERQSSSAATTIEGDAPRFFVGGAANPFGDPFDFRPIRLAKKAAAGAQFIQTQLIFDVALPRIYEAGGRHGSAREGSHHGRGWPHQMPGAAKYMRDKVPGMDVA